MGAGIAPHGGALEWIRCRGLRVYCPIKVNSQPASLLVLVLSAPPASLLLVAPRVSLLLLLPFLVILVLLLTGRGNAK
jgi:hypothetical protein